jgi:hypothetical protein
LAQIALSSSGVYTVPTSVALVTLTARGFGKWMSVRFFATASIAAGDILPRSPDTVSTFVPLEKNSGAPHSSVSTWASS